MNDDGTDLLRAVDDLTRPQRVRTVQDVVVAGERVRQVTTSILPPLLTQLATAIRASMGGTATGASLAHERNVLDMDALYKLVQIESQIRDWCRLLKITPGKDPADNLRAWYVAYLRTRPSVEVDTANLRILTRWSGVIKSKLDPWRERELAEACPACGAKTWWRDGDEFARPLVVRYRPDSPDMIREARGLCRACAEVWGARELAYELEQRAASEGDTSRPA